MSILNRLLGKLGARYEDLSDEERRTFNTWQDALSGRKLTDDDVKNFFDVELLDVMSKLRTSKLDSREDTFLKMKLDFIMKTKEFLSIPDKERAMVEQHISTQL